MTNAVPKVEDFYFPVLSCLDTLGGSGQITEIDAAATEFLHLLQEVLDARYPKSGALIVPDRISWARTYLRIGELLKSEGRGLWVITDAGRETLAKGEVELREIIRVAGNAHNKQLMAKKANEKADKLAMVESGEMPDDEGAWADLLLAKVRRSTLTLSSDCVSFCCGKAASPRSRSRASPATAESTAKASSA